MGRSRGSNDAIYGLGFIGALIYYVTQGGGFASILFGIFKAMVWPAFLVYELLSFMGA
jgi:hypothetical protein